MFHRPSLILCICLCISACSDSANENPSVFQHQTDSLKKAQQLEQDLMQKHQQQREQINNISQ